jgi:hypothetical protein
MTFETDLYGAYEVKGDVGLPSFNATTSIGLWTGQGSVVERIKNEPRGACHPARSDALQTCIRLGPRGTRTMKQSFASAARLRGGGPIL